MKRHTSGLCRLIFLKRKSIDDEEVRHLLEKARTTFQREAALLTIESAGGKLELIYWAAPGGEYSGINIGEFPDAGSCAAVVGLIEATGMFSEISYRASHCE